MPSYGGMNIFGISVTMTTTDLQRSRQVNEYFGLDGLEFIDGGRRGRQTEVVGLLVGNSVASLRSVEATFRSLNDGVARTLVDSASNSWDGVCLDAFRPTGRVLRSVQGYYLQPYWARLLHLR
ncbi:hypothetical protein EP7_005231 [Isosphaeraceae bacterium EP7]